MAIIDGRDRLLIMGGGLAGLTLALQLRRACPDVPITVIERNRFPVPEAAFKVGESTSELGAFYLREVLGLREMLVRQQIVKLGLRFFFTADGNRDLALRPEFGPSKHLSAQTYQLDRGRFENDLAASLGEHRIELLEGTDVDEVELGAGGHRIRVSDAGGGSSELRARWLLDASGRPGILKRRLGLKAHIDHPAHAAWFRISERLDLDGWSADPTWKNAVSNGLRWTSTNHLMGRGYWVWIIPLSSGSTSIGVVADARLHPFEQLNSHEHVMDWIRNFEPQLGGELDARREALQDFRVMRNYAHGCTKVFSAERWGITGEAGVFTDPFYSPGTDFIAFANTYLTDIVARELAGESGLDALVDRHNSIYLTTFRDILHLFVGQLPMMGNPLVMSVKSTWDFVRYWGQVGRLFTHGKYQDPRFMLSVGSDVYRISRLDQRMQAFFREWDAADSRRWAPGLVAYQKIGFVYALNKSLLEPIGDAELVEQTALHADFLEGLAADIQRYASGRPVTSPYDFAEPLLQRSGETGSVAEAFEQIWPDLDLGAEAAG